MLPYNDSFPKIRPGTSLTRRARTRTIMATFRNNRNTGENHCFQHTSVFSRWKVQVMVILKWAHPSPDSAQVKFYHFLKLGTLNWKRLISYRILGILGSQNKIKINRNLQQFLKMSWKMLFLYVFDCWKHCSDQNLKNFKFWLYFAHFGTKNSIF